MLKTKLKDIATKFFKRGKMIKREERFETNPFSGSEFIGFKSNKNCKSILVNKIAEEQEERNKIVTHRQVEESELIKIFTNNIVSMLNLTAAGVKTLNIVIFAVKNHAIGENVIPLGKKVLQEFLKESNLKLAEKTFRHEITNLVNEQILAKTMNRGEYFVNPRIIFNGDKITLTEILEKKTA